jgi:hypothetical protein
MNMLGQVTYKLQARQLSKMWWRKITVRVEWMVRRMRMIRKGMVWLDRIRDNE